MFGLSLGVSKIGNTLPAPVYALLSGLNAATVGIIALAAVNLARKAVTDKLTRALVFLGGVAGILYTALWFFPVLMIAAGIVTVVWDFRWLHRVFVPFWRMLQAFRRPSRGASRRRRDSSIEISPYHNTTSTRNSTSREAPIHLRRVTVPDERDVAVEEAEVERPAAGARSSTAEGESERVIPSNIQLDLISWKTGTYILVGFLVSFITIMIVRALLKPLSRGVALFANLYLAGTIIFGGGPVVIPLLRAYIVAEGWVSSRDFLLGLAIIQSFPGPNFNFAVYLGSLAVAGTSLSPALGALIGYLGIFTPGIVILVGVMGLWKSLRSRRWFTSLLRGVNAGAVGLVFTAVYKLWQIGYVDVDYQSGSPLGRDPWWVTITATSFVGGAWFGCPAPVAILLGGVMGMIWYGITQT